MSQGHIPRKRPITLPFILLLGLFFILLSGFNAQISLSAADIAPLKKPTMVTKTLSGQIDMCLSCHKETLDKAHGRQVLGCYSCHLGNPLAGTPEEAHKGMVLNPGDLRVAERTCGQEGCHVQQVKDVKNTLMATNRGIISTLRYYWGETGDHNEPLTVEKLLGANVPKSPATNYFRKLCGTCHLWLPRHTLPSFLSEKGGGCTACHNVKKAKDGRTTTQDKHPLITRNIPMENCVRCHNRSGRIGLSYQGLYESEGYGTPFEDGETSSLQLEDGRFVKKIHPDVHFEKGLVCIDCHSQKELMGDGKQRAHLSQQVEIRCTFCHGGKKVLERLFKEQKSKKKFPKLNNLVRAQDGRILLKGKKDQKIHPLNPFSVKKCKNPQHKRLSCQACHSTWVPQCYGCHVRYDRGKRQLDKLAIKETFGMWQEFKSYMRFESPVLGVLEEKPEKKVEGGGEGEGEGSKVVILVPG